MIETIPQDRKYERQPDGMKDNQTATQDANSIINNIVTMPKLAHACENEIASVQLAFRINRYAPPVIFINDRARPSDDVPSRKGP